MRKYWTDEELLALPDDEYKREIVDGELLMMSPAGADHGVVIANILGPLFIAVASAKLGKVLDGQTGCRMQSGDLFCPDISFVSMPRWIADRQLKKTFFTGSPDLVVEVLSPGDRLSVTQKKVRQCFANGARLAWIVDPRTCEVHVLGGAAIETVLREADFLDGEEVVPGFRLALTDIFS